MNILITGASKGLGEALALNLATLSQEPSFLLQGMKNG
jgi:short-subunit dehydrogenase